MEAKYETAEKEKQLKIQQLEIDKNKTELQKRNAIEYGLATGILLLLALAGTIAVRFKEKTKSNKLLTLQKEEIQRKNHEILDSMQYAKRLQTAILPPHSLLDNNLPNSFIFYLPKDIVSGDFYWLYPINDQKVMFAAVDCTGHGVPGAFMSIVGYNLLNRMVGEFGLLKSDEILTTLNKYVAESLHQEEYKDIKDGMDISFCVLDKENLELEYSGANNPLYIIRNNELIETKANKMAIGSYYFRDEKLFNNHKIKLRKGDVIYLFTDGYADQFGGPKGKKFMYGKFKKLLIEIHQKEVSEQKEILITEFNKWKGNLEQVDDICVIGVKI